MFMMKHVSGGSKKSGLVRWCPGIDSRLDGGYASVSLLSSPFRLFILKNNKIHKNKEILFFCKIERVNCESEDKSESFNSETIADWTTRFSCPFKIWQSPEFKN